VHRLRPSFELEADGLYGLGDEFAQADGVHRQRARATVFGEHGEHPLQGANFPLGNGEATLVSRRELLVARQRLDGQLHTGERVSKLVAKGRAQRGDLERWRLQQHGVEVQGPRLASRARK
jgi:hypothetical protein